MKKIDKVLILGSEGFIGQHLVLHAKGTGLDVSGCDINKPKSSDYKYFPISILNQSFSKVFEAQDYDLVINAAGSGNVGDSVRFPLQDFENNSLAVSAALNQMKQFNSKARFIHISSAAVYGNPKSLPINETADTDPVSPYGFHKLISELVCKEFVQLFGIWVKVLRPFSVYGPGLRKQLFWDLYKKYQFPGKTIELWGTGDESRDFIHIKDLVRAVFTVAESDQEDYQVFNVGSGRETTIRDAVNAFHGFMKNDKSIVFNNRSKVGDPLNWRADTSALDSLGFLPETPFMNGIEQTVKWLKNQ